MRYLLDTNICIYLIKGAVPVVRKKFDGLRVGDVGISSVTCCELWFGVMNSSKVEENGQALREFLAPLAIEDFPAAAAQCYGEIRAMLSRAGRIIGSYDLMIAAHAIHERVVLVTNNVGEFSRVPGLQVENWVSGGRGKGEG